MFFSILFLPQCVENLSVLTTMETFADRQRILQCQSLALCIDLAGPKNSTTTRNFTGVASPQ